MNINPISFQGTITVKTPDKDSTKQVENIYKTTKKQDGELLKNVSDIISRKNPTQDLYGRDTLQLHRTLEKITGREIEQGNLGNGKSLYIGGSSPSNSNQKYDSTYNKIYYSDAGLTNGKNTSIVIDLMEPSERKAAATETLSNIRQRIKEMFVSNGNDDRLKAPLDNIPEEKFGKLEEVLNKTLFYLDGNIDRPKMESKAPSLYNAYHAYEALTEKICEVTGLDYKQLVRDEFRCPLLEPNDKLSVRRAIYYLQNQIPKIIK